MMNSIMLIEEGPITTNQEFEDIILEEGAPSLNGPHYKFKAILQTGDIVNVNGRVYPTSLLREEAYSLKPRARQSQLLGELDHPFLETKDPVIIMRRQHKVFYDRVSHKINDLYMEGNKLYGKLETLYTDKGKTLAGLIESGVKIGFSSRAFGRLKRRFDGTYEVSKPFTIITWDAVSNPSHTEARLVEITESVIKDTIYHAALTEGVAMNRVDALIDLVEDYEFLHNYDLLQLINRHIDILEEIASH